jgi:hypothetical protein
MKTLLIPGQLLADTRDFILRELFTVDCIMLCVSV